MRLEPGAQAPDFTAEGWDGSTLTLSDFRGRQVWLAFHRYASCPLCNVNVDNLIKAWPSLRDRLVLLAVFQSPKESISRYVGRQRPPFPLLSDPEEKLYELYGVESSIAGYVSPKNMPGFVESTRRGFMPGRMEGTRTRLPADFLIDEAGRIQLAHYSGVISEHLGVEAVRQFLSTRAGAG